MKSLEAEDEVREEKLSDLEVINFTEWLIFKIKIIYSRSIFEGDNPTEASAIRQEWQDLVHKIGKQGVLGTIDYLLSGHHSVPSFPPSIVEFRKCYRTHVAPTLSKLHVIKKQKNPSDLPKEQNQEGYKQFQELLKKLKPSYLVRKRE